MQRIIRAKVSNSVIAGYNNLGTTGTIGEKAANLVDSSGLLSGISVHVLTAFASSGGSASAWATSDYHGLAENYWEWAWGSPTSEVGSVQLRGFVPNAIVTMQLTGYSFNTRHVDFVVNGVTATRYLNTNTLPPNAPVSIDVAADASGFITITGNKVGSDWYFNGFTATYADSPIISGIDKLEMDSVSVATTNDPAFIATSVAITSDGVTKNVPATNLGNGSFSFTPPMWIDGETALLPGPQSIMATDGSTTSQSFIMALNTAPQYNTVELTSISTFSYSTIGTLNPPLVNGSLILFNTADGRVSADGEWEDIIWDGEYWINSNFLGTLYLWDRSPGDKIARLCPLEITGGDILIDLTSLYKQSESPIFDGLYRNSDRP